MAFVRTPICLPSVIFSHHFCLMAAFGGCRLPTAVTADCTLSNTLSTWQHQGQGSGGANPGHSASSLTECMLSRANCDRFVKSKPGTKDLPLSFRTCFTPRLRVPSSKQGQSESMEQPKAASYLTRRPELHRTPRLLLLHAECQIGKTGAYLSLISQLRSGLQQGERHKNICPMPCQWPEAILGSAPATQISAWGSIQCAG